jgi:quinol monooxygenase YgiN
MPTMLAEVAQFIDEPRTMRSQHCRGRKSQWKGSTMEHSNVLMTGPRGGLTRRSALSLFAAIAAIASFPPLAAAQSRSEPTWGTMTRDEYATSKKTLKEVNGGGLLVVAQWEAREGQADAVAAILRRYLPEAQNEWGTKLFLIGRGTHDPAQFLFYELFEDEAALAAHQASGYFETLIAHAALPLLSRCERSRYTLL